jgi:hypothetical protein
MLTVCEAGCEATCLTHGQHFFTPITKNRMRQKSYWFTIILMRFEPG